MKKTKKIVNWFVFTFGLAIAILWLFNIKLASEEFINLFIWFYYGYIISWGLNDDN